MLLNHYDKLSPEFRTKLATLRARMRDGVTQLKPLPRDSGGSSSSSSSSGNSASPPPQEQKSMAMSQLDNPGIMPKVFGEHVAAGWRAATAGSGFGQPAVRSSGRAPSAVRVPDVKMVIGGRGPIRF
jgi:hypothetical protein